VKEEEDGWLDNFGGSGGNSHLDYRDIQQFSIPEESNA
jgi:hypothetical protein